MFTMQDGWKTCVIYPSYIGLLMPALPRVQRTGLQKAKASMRKVMLALTQRQKQGEM